MAKKHYMEGIDLFCGAGGVTTGIAAVNVAGRAVVKVIACVNHDPNAIKSHAANHKRVRHFTEDIRSFDPHRFPAFSPGVKTFLWASLECTNFSNAKGGLPRDPDSRTLANHMFKYIEYLDTDFIFIENVREFMDWGPLNAKLKPIKSKKGIYFRKWVVLVGTQTQKKKYIGNAVPVVLPKALLKCLYVNNPDESYMREAA